MKKISILSIVSSLIILLAIHEGCRKPKEPVKPIDPCVKAVLMNAVQYTYDYCGQFEMTDRSNMTYRIYAVNFGSYADRIFPVKQYRIAYTEVSCSDDDNFKRGDQIYCGCFGPQVKCIRINCVVGIPNLTHPPGCMSSEVNPPAFSDRLTHVLKSTGISGNMFSMKLGYSGCDRTEINNFKLALQETRLRCPSPEIDRVFLAKAVADNDLICQAYFEKDVCFDLSVLKSYMISEKYDMSKPGIIRLQYRDGSDEDFIYQTQNLFSAHKNPTNRGIELHHEVPMQRID